MKLEEFFLRILLFSHNSIINPVFHTLNYFMHHQLYKSFQMTQSLNKLHPCSVGGKVIERRGFCVFSHFKQQDTRYVQTNRTHCMCQTRGHTLYAKQQNILYVSTNTLMKINRIFKFANTKAQTGLQTTSFQFTPTHLFHSGLICYYTSMYVSVFK